MNLDQLERASDLSRRLTALAKFREEVRYPKGALVSIGYGGATTKWVSLNADLLIGCIRQEEAAIRCELARLGVNADTGLGPSKG